MHVIRDRFICKGYSHAMSTKDDKIYYEAQITNYAMEDQKQAIAFQWENFLPFLIK